MGWNGLERDGLSKMASGGMAGGFRGALGLQREPSVLQEMVKALGANLGLLCLHQFTFDDGGSTKSNKASDCWLACWDRRVGVGGLAIVEAVL